ncbi:MAG: lipoate--protein ligase [Bacillales bacterium]|jgi:lipoate-protein ligase A|nr:lipoate--protein ligase [Bacillales bacterium]
MIFLDNKGITDPKINLAIEEYALKNLAVDKTILLFYINKPSIIIGKNQNTIEEINQAYVNDHQIDVVRRLSGGGAVYHDLGNLNFSFITKDDGNSFHNFRMFTQPVIDALKSLGIQAELTGRNDIEVNGRKISGNAQFASRGRMFNHGTLIFNSEIEQLVSALNVKQEKIESKGIKSIRSRVANISEFLTEEMTMEEFKMNLLQSIFRGVSEIPTYEWTEADWIAIEKISEERYQNWDWNYGKSPSFNIQKQHRFPIGSIDARLTVENGRIESCKIYGDFFGIGDAAEVEDSLVGVKYTFEALSEALKEINVKHYFGNISHGELANMLC